MKRLIILASILCAGCGGGGGSDSFDFTGSWYGKWYEKSNTCISSTTSDNWNAFLLIKKPGDKYEIGEANVDAEVGAGNDSWTYSETNSSDINIIGNVVETLNCPNSSGTYTVTRGVSFVPDGDNMAGYREVALSGCGDSCKVAWEGEFSHDPNY